MICLFIFRLLDNISRAINITDITTTENVAIPIGHTLCCTNLTTIDVNGCLSKHITISITSFLIGLVTIAQHVEALTATIDITQYMAIIDFHLS